MINQLVENVDRLNEMSREIEPAKFSKHPEYHEYHELHYSTLILLNEFNCLQESVAMAMFGDEGELRLCELRR